jgi:hypothetical protein
MKILRLTTLFLFVSIPLVSVAQTNPFLKKYAGAYNRLNFGEDLPTAASEKIIFTIEGKWTSTSFPTDDNGVVSKIPVKKAGTWKASDGVITIVTVENGTATEEEYRLQDFLFSGSNMFLLKVFVPNPVFLVKYAGKYHLIYGNEDAPHDYTPTLELKADGKFIQSTPTTDLRTGAISKTPITEQGVWKAQDGLMLVTFVTEGKERTSEFRMRDGMFSDRVGSTLKKVPPPGLYLGKYAGIYNMVGDGQAVTPKSNKYVLKADGTGTWSFYTQLDEQGTLSATPTVVKGTWKASEGLIQLYFNQEGGGGEHGGEMLTDFKFKDGAFRAEGVMLKKAQLPK